MTNQQWEYKIMYIPPDERYKDTEELMDRMGRENWELVSVVFRTDCNGQEAYFKRPIKS